MEVEPPQNGIPIALLLEGAARPEKELCYRVSDAAAQESEGWALCRLPLRVQEMPVERMHPLLCS